MEALESMSVETEERNSPLRWIAGAAAVVVTLAIVAGLVYYRSHSTSPVKNPAVGSATVTGVTFSCKLPVLGGAAAGFVSFPGGAVTIDPHVNLQSAKGGYGYSYDSQVKRWVPVPATALSPDGRSYAYLAQTSGVPGEMDALSLHTHDIVSGSDRVLWQGQGSPTGPDVTWLAAGIYFSAVVFPSGGLTAPAYPALYVADSSRAGTPRRVGPNPPPQPPAADQAMYSGPDQFSLVGGGAAWGTGQRVPPTLPASTSAPAPGTFGPDRVLRMDLTDGSVTTWYTVTGNDLVSIVGLDAQGRPILSLFQPTVPVKGAPDIVTYEPPPVTLLLLTGPNQTAAISAGNPDFHMGSQPWADSHGIWFGSWNAIWLYTPGSGLRQVATLPDDIFPSPTPPPGYPVKGGPVSGSRVAMPAYMQGTLLMPAGPCV